MLDSDVRVGLYLLTPELNRIATEYPIQLKNHFRGNRLVASIIDLASKGMINPSLDELIARLKILDVNQHNCDVVASQYNNLDKSSTVIEDIRSYFQTSITSILLAEASKITDVNKYLAEVSRIRDLDFGSKNRVESSVTRKKFSDLDVNEINDAIKGAVPSFWAPFNSSNPYHGYRCEQLITIVGGPGSGKSHFCMREMVENLKLGRKCVYCAIGDLIEEDFLVRLAAYIFKVPLSDVILDLEYFKKRLIAELPAIETKLDILFIKPGNLNAGELRNYLDKHVLTNEPTTIFIDYDSNLAGGDNLYAKGGEIYCVAEEIASRKGYLVFIVSQPKMDAYNKEKFGMEGVGESGRKNHISATIITIGRHPSSVNPVGYITIAKQRRGLLFSAPYFRDLNGEFIFINENTKTKLTVSAKRMTIVTKSSMAEQLKLDEQYANVG